MFENEMLLSLRGTPTRWRCTRHFCQGYLRFMDLVDCHPDVSVLERHARGVTLHCEAGTEHFKIEALKNQFEAACESVSAGFSGLPQPLDFFYTTGLENLPAASAGMWPVLINSTVAGKKDCRPLKPYFLKNNLQGNLTGPLIKFCSPLVAALREVHRNGKVLRQLPLATIKFNPPVEYKIVETFSICNQGKTGYRQDVPFLCLTKAFSAPECFESDGKLTPATDVYVLAKTLLSFLGVQWDRGAVFPPDITPLLAEVEQRYEVTLPDHIRRFFLTSLQLSPDLRYQRIEDAVNALRDRGGPIKECNRKGMVKKITRKYNNGKLKNQDGIFSFKDCHVTAGKYSLLVPGMHVFFDVEEDPSGTTRRAVNIRIRRFKSKIKVCGLEDSQKKKFGFISPVDQGGKDIFFHYDILTPSKRNDVAKGKHVEFSIQESSRGLAARDIVFT